MSIPAWIPIAISAVGTSISLLAFAYQVRRARFTQSVDLLFKLENDFFGGAKCAQRALACRELQQGNALEAEPILDFFETMALLLRRGALDAEMVRHTFFYWIDHYYQALQPYIVERQQSEPLVWEDLSAMHKSLEKHKARALMIPTVPMLSDEQIAAFLVEEQTEVR
jgi:hypothetical protein